MECMRGKTLKHKLNLRIKTISLKPSKLLPHWHQVPKWMKNLKGQYSMSSSPKCVFLIKSSENICTCPNKNIWRKSNYIEDQILQIDIKEKEASTNEANNQTIQRTNWTKRIA